MSETRYCILCGEPFESDDPEAFFCPDHGGKTPVKPGAERVEVVRPPVDSKQKVDSTKPGLMADWKPGDLILDTYEVKGVLGKGGFGAVYRVYHKGWNMDLAVKRALNLDEANKQDFVNEAQKWIDLGLHPHIISCFYVRNIDGFPHTFAELAEGGSLESWIQGEKFDLYEGDRKEVLGRILDIAIQFAWGLAYAHEQGLVHQDVKPQNALMTPDGVLKVTDFGLAKARGTTGAAPAEGLGEDILVSGGSYTPAYCSPEQAGRQKLSFKTDIWSWGVSVLEMFTGGVSWMGGQMAASALESYLQRTGEEEDIPPMPGVVAELLRACFQEEPQDRPKDMVEIADRLMAVYQKVTGQPYRREVPKPADLRADSLNNTALSMLDLGKPANAESFLEQAIAADGQHVEATYNLGLLRWRSGRAADVDLLKQLGQIQQDRPEDADVAGALGWVCLESGRFGEALAYFEQAGRLGSDHSSAEGLKLAKPLAEGGAGACLRTFEGHRYDVNSVAISPDGCWALSGSSDKTLKLWDLASGACLRTFEGHTRGVNPVAFSPDGRRALSGSGDGTLKLWDLAGGACLRTFEGHSGLSVAISPDGRWALSGSSQTIKLWDLAGGACLWSIEDRIGGVYSVAISPDGHRALSGSYFNTLKLWDLAGGACLRTFEGHRWFVNSIAFSPDGRQALSGSRDKTLKLWDLAGGACLRTFEGHIHEVKSIAISSDGRWALSGSMDQTIKLWDLAQGTCLRTFEGHTGAVRSVAISPDGRQALSGGDDNTLKLWDLAWVNEEKHVTAPLRYARGLEGSEADRRERIHAAYLAQSRQLMANYEIAEALVCLKKARAIPGYERANTTLALSTSLGARARIKGFREGWLTDTFKEHKIWNIGWNTQIAFSPNGRYALSGSADKSLELWDLAGGACLRTFEGHSGWGVNSVAFSPDGRQALSGGYDRMLKLWDLAGGGCLRTFEAHIHWVNSVAFSPDGHRALSAGGLEDHTLKLWDLVGGACLRTFEDTDSVNAVAFSPDGQQALSGGYDHMLKLWDLAGGICLRTYEGHTDSVMAVAFSPDGHWALSGSADKTLKLWDLAGGICLRTCEGHAGSVQSVAFSPDGHWALSGSADKTLKLWDLVTGACLRTFEGHTDIVQSVAFSPDGRRALSGSQDQTLMLWNLEWHYAFPGWADWDEGARPYLESFLTLHTPFAGELPQDRAPSEEEIRLSLTRQGAPTWTEDDFQGLLTELGQRGYGWLREEGVRRRLDEMAAERG